MAPGPVLVVALQARRLQGALEALLSDETFVAADDLGGLAGLLDDRRPEVALLYRDNGFDGPEFKQVTRAPFVKWVHVSGSGYEFLQPIERRDLVVTNGQGLRSRNLAEMLIGALIALNNGLLAYRDKQRARVWRPTEFQPLQGQTLLIVGTGQIGTWTARYGKALGMTVIGSNRDGHRLEPYDEVLPYARLDVALARADVVSLHLRLNDETRGRFGADAFARMKSSALFINTARGGLVDQAALCAALARGRLRGAYLDVFEQEPLPPESPLWAMDNLLMTPHAADMVRDWDIKAAEFFAENLTRWRDGGTLSNLVQTPQF